MKEGLHRHWAAGKPSLMLHIKLCNIDHIERALFYKKGFQQHHLLELLWPEYATEQPFSFA